MDTDAIVRFVPLIAAIIATPLVYRFYIQRQLGVVRQKNPLEAVGYFRKMGFFADYQDLPDEALAAKIQELHEKTWGTPLDPKHPLFDQYILLWDKKRVWCKPVEVAMGNDAYVNTLKEWAAISRGAFDPQDIKETWEGPEGPIEVAFKLADQQHTIHPEFLKSSLDDVITKDIYALTQPTGYLLVKLATFAPAVFIVFLTKKEMMKLVVERRWDFRKYTYTGKR